MPEGVSIVVCCHNSAQLLPDTLACLAAQEFTTEPPPAEVIVVDNASTDQTNEIARSNWREDGPLPLRVVSEPTLGLTPARLRGIAEARYEYICFVDDDNRVNTDWVENVFRVMTAHPEAGACGGQVTARAATVFPPWFDRFQSYYAVGQQAERPGDVTESRGYLWGAGLCLRKKAWASLVENQFDFLLSDRKGSSLSSGGDAELCYALRLNGWRLWYEPRLIMQHFLPEARLQWTYLRRLSHAFGAATAGFDSYDMALKGEPRGFGDRLRRSWGWQTFATIRYLLRRPFKVFRAVISPMEGDADALRIENLWGRLLELLRNRRSYVRNLERIRTATCDKL
jgi:glycosyltransferase involved in cell wall biosynthesis